MNISIQQQLLTQCRHGVEARDTPTPIALGASGWSLFPAGVVESFLPTTKANYHIYSAVQAHTYKASTVAVVSYTCMHHTQSYVT